MKLKDVLQMKAWLKNNICERNDMLDCCPDSGTNIVLAFSQCFFFIFACRVNSGIPTKTPHVAKL